MVLEPVDDEATSILGDGWRIPTIDEWKELYEKCNHINSVVYAGEEGIVFVSRNSEGILFLPAKRFYDYSSCNYWSSSLNPKNSQEAECLCLYGGSGEVLYCDFGTCFRPMLSYIRPVLAR